MKISLPKLNFLVMIGILIMTVNVSLSYSQFLYFPVVYGALYRLGLLVFVLSILLKNYSPKALMAFAVVGLTALYSALKSQNYGFLITVITCFAIYKEDIRSVLKTIFEIELIFFIMHTMLALFIAVLFGAPLNMSISGEMRYSFGFSHPNTFSLYFFQLVLLWVALYYPKRTHKCRCILFLFIISLAVYRFTLSLTMLLSAIILCGMLLLVCFNIKIKWLNAVAKYVFPVTAVCMIVFYMLFSSQLISGKIGGIVAELDHILGSRIHLAAYGYYHYGLTLFGQDLSQYAFSWEENWGMTRYYTDGTYPLFAINIGIIWIGIISVLFYKLAKKNDVIVNVLIIIWALYGVSETHVINGYVCFPIFLVTQINKCPLSLPIKDVTKIHTKYRQPCDL